MPDIAQPGIVGAREDLSDVIFAIDPQSTPLLAAIPKGKAPKGYLHESQAVLPKRGKKTGVPAGEPRGDPKQASVRKLVYSCPHELRWDWGVAKQTIDVMGDNVAGIADLVADEIMFAMANVKRMQDEILGDTGDLVDVNDGPTETRGAGSAISSAPQGSHPIDPLFLPTAAQIYTGDLSALTEDTFRDLISACWMRGNTVRRYMGVCGMAIKKTVGTWSIRKENVDGFTNVRQFQQSGLQDRVLSSVVDSLETDGGTVELHVSGNLNVPRTSDDTFVPDYNQANCCYIFPMDDQYWEMGQSRPMRNDEAPTDVASRQGTVSCIFDNRMLPTCMAKINAANG
ncbi:MAG TPA: DUF5309 family protein [Opitutales bacterium]|nr:DUF5309 family protein [Opitutales bacterium]